LGIESSKHIHVGNDKLKNKYKCESRCMQGDNIKLYLKAVIYNGVECFSSGLGRCQKARKSAHDKESSGFVKYTELPA
jgi:hypothetical protein